MTGERIPNQEFLELAQPSLLVDSVLTSEPQMNVDLAVSIEQERTHLALELARIPPGTVAKAPKHNRRRLGELVGSDTEEITAVLRVPNDENAQLDAEPPLPPIPVDDEDEDFTFDWNYRRDMDEGESESDGDDDEENPSRTERRRSLNAEDQQRRRRRRRRRRSGGRDARSPNRTVVTPDWIVPDDLMLDDDQPYEPKASSSSSYGRKRKRKGRKSAVEEVQSSGILAPSSWVNVSSRRAFPFLPQVTLKLFSSKISNHRITY